MSVLGSRKKSKSNNRNRAGQSGRQAAASRPVQNDKYAKYAGAVSNKSKRNYADLKLVHSDRLKDYGAESGRRSSARTAGQPNGQGVSHLRSVSSVNERNGRTQKSDIGRRNGQAAKHTKQTKQTKQSQKTPKSAARKSRPAKVSDKQVNLSEALSSLGSWVGTVSSGVLQGVKAPAAQENRGTASRKKTSGKPSQKKTTGGVSAPKGGKVPDYQEDEYTKALNNADFYGPVLEKYYLKYPEKQEERKSPPGASASRTQSAQRKAHKRPMKAVDAAVTEDGQHGEQSIAAIAVKNRGTARKRKYARVVQTGKAKGSVPKGTVHRKVHRIDRRRSLFLYAASAASVVTVLSFFFFFWGFKVKRIEITGETPYSDTRIAELCDFAKGDNLMFIDAAASEQKVVETLPYVESCTIKRAIPNTVEVNVTCAVPLGVVETSTDFWAVVSTSGKILESVSNVAVVSGSDLNVTYNPDVRTVDEVAASRQLPVLTGLDFDESVVGGHVDSTSVEQINGFNSILSEAGDFGANFSKLKFTDRGYEAEYEGRINIVLGDTKDTTRVKKRIDVANHIICERGDIGEHEMGEITYFKNQTFFNPSYDISQEEITKYDEKHKNDGINRVTAFAEALLERGVQVRDTQKQKTAEETASDSLTQRDILTRESDLQDPAAT